MTTRLLVILNKLIRVYFETDIWKFIEILIENNWKFYQQFSGFAINFPSYLSVIKSCNENPPIREEPFLIKTDPTATDIRSSST